MSTAPNIVFHPDVRSNFSTATFQCTKTPLPSPFVAQRKKEKKKKAIHTRLHTCCERIAWKNGGKGRAKVRKVFDIPFNPVGPINRDPILATSPRDILRGRELITEWKLGSWLGGSVGLSLLKISFDNVGQSSPAPSPNWVSCNGTYTRFNSTTRISGRNKKNSRYIDKLIASEIISSIHDLSIVRI